MLALWAGHLLRSLADVTFPHVHLFAACWDGGPDLLILAYLLLLPGQIETIDSPTFAKELQTGAVTATVCVVNRSRQVVGSGVILGRKASFVYVLTAYHVVEGANRLEVMTFSVTSYPKAYKVYRCVQLVAKAHDMRDLALLRIVTDDPMPGSLSLCPARLVPDGMGFEALTVGCLGGEAPTCLVDTVNGKKLARRQAVDKAAYFWEVDRRQPAGGSGGPLVDRRGYLLGVCSGTNNEKSYFCHIDGVRAFLKNNGFDWLI